MYQNGEYAKTSSNFVLQQYSLFAFCHWYIFISLPTSRLHIFPLLFCSLVIKPLHLSMKPLKLCPLPLFLIIVNSLMWAIAYLSQTAVEPSLSFVFPLSLCLPGAFQLLTANLDASKIQLKTNLFLAIREGIWSRNFDISPDLLIGVDNHFSLVFPFLYFGTCIVELL